MELIGTEDQGAIRSIEQMFAGFETYKVEGPADVENASDWLALIKQKTKELEEKRKSLTKPLDESKRRIMDVFRHPLEVLERAERGIKRGVVAWHEEQERHRQEVNRKIAEQAAAQAAEQKKAAEEQAAAAAAWGDDESAAEIVEQAPVVTAPRLLREQKTPTDGITLRDNWKGRIHNFEAFAKWAVTAGEFGLLAVDQRALDYRAKGCKGKTEIPGVEWINERSVASRT